MKLFIEEEEIDIAFISESWERQDQPLESIIDIENYVIISNPFLRKNSGGKPAIIINSVKFNVEKPAIDVPWGVEIVWAVLTPKRVTNSSKIKKLIIASFYSKPSSRKKSLLMDHISDVYHSMLARYNDGVFFYICGDRNDLKIDAILSLNQNFKQCVDKPTRLSPPSIIDVIITDLHKFYQVPSCEPPLDVDSDKIGSPSDHLMVVMTPLNAVNNKKLRNKKI